MNLLTKQQLSVKPIRPDDEECLKSQIIFNGTTSGTIVDGLLLEACIEWKGHFLAFLTDDIPFEEVLHIHFLDPNLALLDSFTLGELYLYAGGNFENLHLIEPNTVHFNFFGKTKWAIDLSLEKHFRFPVLSTPLGVKTPLRFSGYLRIHSASTPQA